MRNIVLIGMMGSGKSSVGALLSKRLNLKFIDTDSLIEERTGEEIVKTFSESEEHFRSIEREVVCELLGLDPVIASEAKQSLPLRFLRSLRSLGMTKQERRVIATGGGTICIKDGVEILKALGQTIYLKTTAVELTRRLINSNIKRPLLSESGTFDDLLSRIEAIESSRAELYDSAGLTISTDDLLPMDVCNAIISKLLIFP